MAAEHTAVRAIIRALASLPPDVQLKILHSAAILFDLDVEAERLRRLRSELKREDLYDLPRSHEVE
jgi:hypothetical protein